MAEADNDSTVGDSYEHWPIALKHAAEITPKITRKYTFFFGHIGPSDTLACLSPWHPSPFKDQAGNQFATLEHYFMYQKAMLMNDQGVAQRILRHDTTPSDAKQLGRQVKGYDSGLWEAEREGIVFRGNLLKYQQNPIMRKTLLSTNNEHLVEASSEDRIWGIGFAADEAEGRESEWGLNLMGKAVMKVRDYLRKDSNAENSNVV